MGSSGAARRLGMLQFTLTALCWLFCAALSISLSSAQVPVEPAPNAGIVDVMPRELTRTMDTVSQRNQANDAHAARKKLQQDGNCLLPPLTTSTPAPTVAADQLKIPDKAIKEYEQACVALGGRKLPDAEKHLRAAVREYTKYSPAWVTLGQLLVRQARIDDGKQACVQASVGEPGYAPSYLCLADIAARARDWTEVLNLTSHALTLGPTYAVVAYEYDAAANMNLHNLAAAEKSGLRAVEMDRDHREPRIHFVLAQIYEAKGDRQNEANQLREYLKYATDPNDVAVVTKALERLANPTPSKATDVTASAKPAPPVEIPRRSWAPPDIDEEVPSAQLDVACPLAEILQQTSHRTQGLIESLQRFSADERIEQIDFDKNGKGHSRASQVVNYVAVIENSSGFPRISEYRMGSSPAEKTSVVDTGSAAFALIFHPSHVGSFDFRCEGSTRVHGTPAWQLHFEEPMDSKQAFQALRIGASTYLPRLKGRAWIASDTYEVLRMETDLASRIPQIDFNLEHLVIDYAPLEFKTRSVRLWVPQSATLYIAYKGHRYQRVHTFNRFHLFSVDSDQAIKEPKPTPEPPSQFVAARAKLMADARH